MTLYCKAKDPVHTLPEAQPITSNHALLSWELGALPFNEMLRGTRPLKASCIVGLSITYAGSCLLPR